MGHPLFCTKCCRSSHSSSPFHQIQHWVGEFYEDSWLIDTGFTLHFGHGGKPCPSYAQPQNSHNSPDSRFGLPDFPAELDDPEDELDADPAPDAYMDTVGDDVVYQASEELEDGVFLDPHDQARWKRDNLKYGSNVIVIVHQNGIHHLPVHWCRCPGHVPDDVQALDLHFFPASFKKLRTLFTFQGLDSFLAENQECKTSAWHYYQKLRRFTSSCFPNSVPVSINLYIMSAEIDRLSVGPV